MGSSGSGGGFGILVSLLDLPVTMIHFNPFLRSPNQTSPKKSVT